MEAPFPVVQASEDVETSTPSLRAGSRAHRDAGGPAVRTGYRLPVAVGLLLIGGGLALGAATDTSSSYTFVAGWLALAGLGMGSALAPATDAVLGVLPRSAPAPAPRWPTPCVRRAARSGWRC
jgi:hypothetical protein